ncbi:unnamed protein product [Notodromas monacha]|uniref:Uncharacterized protein n=1 Tax=Notodromas monacha TaxID=399045 RepID=A0A7R9BF71_9CRUS|nr:unnamed protein product [Notodromas monacha]CAG0913086.1 unnamed protein product [Notodromas monacha]
MSSSQEKKCLVESGDKNKSVINLAFWFVILSLIATTIGLVSVPVLVVCVSLEPCFPCLQDVSKHGLGLDPPEEYPDCGLGQLLRSAAAAAAAAPTPAALGVVPSGGRQRRRRRRGG